MNYISKYLTPTLFVGKNRDSNMCGLYKHTYYKSTGSRLYIVNLFDRCDRSAEDAYSSMAPDLASEVFQRSAITLFLLVCVLMIVMNAGL